MRWGSLGVLLAALAFATSSGAAEPNVLQLEFVANASSPVYLTAPPGDASRLFIVQQGSSSSALIRLMRDGGAPTTFLTVDLITAGGERGLLSMAFHPDYATNRKFYVYYTDPEGDMTVAEYLRDAANPDIADPTTRRVLIEIPHPDASNHNGGQLQFGPDGYLYLATGDGGGGGDPFRSAQNLEDLRGKMLRIDPEVGPEGEPYTIPPDNPFVGIAGRDEIWAYGLRNPWRFSFDRQTGNLTIGDVGQGAWEEVDFALAPSAGRGVNFGWSCMEGRHPYSNNCPEPPNHVPPVWEYSHGSGCSITAGYVVRPPNLPSFAGRYFYTDYCTSDSGFGLRSVLLAIPDATDDQPTGLFANSVTSYGEDALGRVYVMGGGVVQRFTEGGPPPPPPPPPPVPPPPPPPSPPPPPPPPRPPPPPPPPPPPAPPAATCRVPRLRGMTPSAARALIRRSGCAMGHVRSVRSRRARRGRVIYQGPHAGARRPRGTRVSFILAR